MPVDLVGALGGWVVSLVGAAGIRLVRRSPDERALGVAMGLAIDKVIAQADPCSQEMLRLGLGECFSTPPRLRLRLDASTSVGEGLRAAIAAQVAQLDDMGHSDTGQPFYQAVAVDRVWLVEQVTVAILTALRQVVAAGGLAELIHGVDAADVVARLEELRVSAPAAATRTLPRDIGSFTGRHGELQRLMMAVTGQAATGGVVGIHAIDGMAGIGKTAFVVHAAHQLASRFPDGQIFLRLHAHTPGHQPVDPADALATLLLTIGITPQQIPAGMQARELLWRDQLSGKKVLLVLDDATGPQQVDPLLPGTAESLVLITSRRRLAALDDVLSISLDILAPEEAAKLFLRVAARPDLAPTDAAVAEVTRLCGYLPLAIRLMAGRLSHRTWTVADVATDLTAARDRLAAMDAGERSVAAAFDLSYQNLAADQQQLFRRLGLQPGADIDAYAAAALSDTTVATTRRHLEDLYDLHLLDEPVRGRYRLHDLVRDYARTLAATDPPAERDAALDRLLDYYLHTTATATGHLATYATYTTTIDPPVAHPPSSTSTPELVTRGSAVAWLEAERANLQAAIDYAALHARHVHAIHLPAAMHDFLRDQGSWSQALALHCTALDAARGAGDRLGEAATLKNLGVMQQMTGDHPAATASQEQALALYRDLGDRLGEATVLHNQGDIQRLNGDYPAATVSQEQALALYRDLGDRLGEANTLNCLGIVCYLTGGYRGATASLRQALALFRDLGARLGEAHVLNNLGDMQRLTGDYRGATASLRQALALFRDLGIRLGEANALNDLGDVRRLTGDYRGATASLEQALALYRDLGDRHGEAEALNNLGQLLWASSTPVDSCAHHVQALGIARALRTPREEARALEGIGQCHLQKGQASEGATYLQQALTLYRRLESPDAKRVETTLINHGLHGPGR
jgi:tetratricopeptide (TPR) repeat protein